MCFLTEFLKDGVLCEKSLFSSNDLISFQITEALYINCISGLGVMSLVCCLGDIKNWECIDIMYDGKPKHVFT